MAVFAAMEPVESRGQTNELIAPLAFGPDKGSLVICGGGVLPETLRTKVVELAGGEHARLVVISTASQTADTPDVETYVAWWRQQKLAEMTILHTRSRELADTERFVEPLTRATGVWFMGGNQAWLIDAYSGTRTEAELRKVLERGGVIGGTSAGAAVMSKLMIRRGGTMAELGRGFGFLEGAVVDQHFVRRMRQDRLLKVVEQHPQLVGLGIDEATALLVQGRRLTVLGDSEVRVCFARTDSREPIVESLRAGDKADLAQLNRIALARLQPQPRLPQSVPQVSDGTLVIVGGDAVPSEATKRFVAAAGGAEAQVALVSFDGEEFQQAETDLMDKFREAGVKNVRRVEFSSRQQANDPKLTEILKTAGGVWLCGARPQRCVESCLGSMAEQLCRDVLRRGGVIGGTAAGGLMHGEVLVNASPVPTKRVMIDGYDRGFGFLPGVAIAPSTQMGEPPSELTQLQKELPEVVGLGIDDATALIVHGHTLEVVGKNQVAVLDGVSKNDGPRSAVLQAGDRYDFKDRSRVTRKDRE
jgi:cyanophycinase